jgi:hypothetical protein
MHLTVGEAKTLQWLDSKKRMTQKQQHYLELEMAEVTGRPVITQMAQQMNRKVD